MGRRPQRPARSLGARLDRPTVGGAVEFVGEMALVTVASEPCATCGGSQVVVRSVAPRSFREGRPGLTHAGGPASQGDRLCPSCEPALTGEYLSWLRAYEARPWWARKVEEDAFGDDDDDALPF